MFELIHTSAPRGLFGGSGYTTVAATQGMPDALRKVLESLSGYEQVFEYGSPQFQSNPEAYICQPVGQAAGKSWWVISRIVVADKDYTGRSNYLAHHVALDNNELPHAGPAALARTFPWMSSWAGEPRMLPVRSMPSIAAPAPPMAAPAWTRAGLDAGWAGHLAEQARSRRGIIQLVYPQTVDPLSLIADAVALLPPAERWDARFHTHTSRPRPDQAWAWFPAEAGATTDLARRPGVVYLAMRPQCPTAGPLVDQARGKAASIPAMGGAGNLNFHGSHGNAVLPVATAVVTSTDPYAPAGRGAAGSWGAPPVPKKGSLVGPILHWTAHGLMVVVVCALTWLMLNDLKRFTEERDDLQVKSESNLKTKDASIAEKMVEIIDLKAFKEKQKAITKIDSAEFKGVGEMDARVPSKLAQELAERLADFEKGYSHLVKDQLLDPAFGIKEDEYLVSKDDALVLRKKWLELKNTSETNALKLAAEVQKIKAMAESIGEKKNIIEFAKLANAEFTKAGSVEIQFNISEKDAVFMSRIKEFYGKDETAMKSLKMLALGIKPVDAFSVENLRLYATDLNKSTAPKEKWWQNVFDNANELSGRKARGEQLTATTVLYAYCIIKSLAPVNEPPFNDANINAYFSKVLEVNRKYDDCIAYIATKLTGDKP